MERPIFVVGCPRSGTTLLQLMLHAHPRIAIPPETRFLLPAYFKRARWGDLRESVNRRRLGEWIVTERRRKFFDLGLDAEQTLAEIEAAPPTLGSICGAVFQAYARSHGKPRWGDKRPAYIRYLPELFRLFPDAQVVHIVRDGRDCVGSLKQLPGWGHDAAFSISTWAGAIVSGRRAQRRLPADSYYELQYERLVADPVAELSFLCGFLDEDFDAAMLRPHEIAWVTPARKTHHARTHQEVDTAVVGAWEHRLTRPELQLCEYVLGDRLRAYGYPLTDPGRPPARDIVHYLRTNAARTREHLDQKIRDRWRLLRRRTDLACRLEPDHAGRLSV